MTFKEYYEMATLTGYNSYGMDKCDIIYVNYNLMLLTC